MEMKIVQAVVGQIINMYENNVMNEYGNECFENWCENGEVFNNNPDLGLSWHEALQAESLMRKLAPHVDLLTSVIEDETD